MHFRIRIFLLMILGFVIVNGQKKSFVLTDVATKKDYAKKDSVAAVKFLDSLAQNNYYFTQVKKVEKAGEATHVYFDKGKNYNQAKVVPSDSLAKALQFRPEIFTKNLDSLKKSINHIYAEKGFAFNRIKTKFKGIKNDVPEVELFVLFEKQRKIDGFVVKGYDKVPKRFIKNLEKEYRGKIYGDKNLVSINQALQNHPFVLLERPPQTLFTKDSTQIYLFLQKKKANSFDGVLGFGNDKTDRFTLNGTLDVNFRNMFNGFEQLNLYWQRNADRAQTFDMKADVPYLLHSNIGLNISTHIFRQDSTFASVKFQPAVYYHISNRQKFGVRGSFESSSVLDSLYTQGTDFTKKGVGVWYDYAQPSEIALFLYKTRIRAEAGFLYTTYANSSQRVQQKDYFFAAEHNLKIIGSHYLNLKGEAALLNSANTVADNELLRFGGWNSLRGFNENSLLAENYYFAGAEYRYLIGGQAYFDAFGQYASLKNPTIIARPKLYSFGVGFNFFLPVGLMSFQISNGSQSGNPFRFSDTKIHWGILSRF